MNNSLHEKIIDYRNRHQSVTLIINGKEKNLLQLEQNLHFSNSLQPEEISAEYPGDTVVLQEEWWLSPEEYDEILQKWPYPKQSHLFPKGWAEAKRICICIEADGRSDRLYINRDAFTDNLMIAKARRIQS